MKAFVALAVVIWILCGVAGSWMLHNGEMRLKTIAYGPISLVKGYNSAPDFSPAPY